MSSGKGTSGRRLGYARVSTEEQATDAQTDELRTAGCTTIFEEHGSGASRARRLARMCVGEPLVNLELHGIDVLDVADGLEALRPHQPDVRVSHPRKLAALEAVVDELRAAGYTFVTMREAAAALA